MSKEIPSKAELLARIFRKSLPLRLLYQELVRALKPAKEEPERCLNIGDEGGVFGYHLRKRGGSWATVVSSEEEAQVARELIEDDVHVVGGDGKLPFDDKTFDVLLMVDFLEKTASDDKFIEECHRVLKHDGRMVVNVSHAKAVSPINPLRHLLGLSPEKRGWKRDGYSESQLFGILKHGFDVSNVRTHTRFFEVLVDTIARAAAGNWAGGHRLEKAARTYAIAAPFYWLAYQLDLFLFMTRGFFLICSAKRRAWLPRKTPVLSDGRRISEAVLSRAQE